MDMAFMDVCFGDRCHRLPHVVSTFLISEERACRPTSFLRSGWKTETKMHPIRSLAFD